MTSSDPIITSWHANAENWIATINNNEIESRNLITNEAIVDIIIKYRPATILDIGCGEGWLTRKLQAHGINANGIDAIPALINNALEKGGEHYSVCSYEDFVNEKYSAYKGVDAVVINFALLDQTISEQLLGCLPKVINDKGFVFIQTLHPWSLINEGDYKSGWKEGSWKGLNEKYVLPYKWYFRTMEAWVQLFSNSGLSVVEIKEPIHPVSKKPASLVFVLSKKELS